MRSRVSTARAARRASSSIARRLPPTCTLSNSRRWPASCGVEPAGLLAERREALVAGGQADAGADGGDVVEVAPEPFQLEQQRARARDLGGGPQPAQALGGVGVGHAVGDGAGAAGARGVGDGVVERHADGGALEAAVLVEEPDVEVQDAVADDVEAEVAGLDHAGVDRADGDLVGVVAVDGHGPARELGRVLDERAQRLVAVEDDAVQVVGLALGPLRGRREVDDARHAPVAGGDALDVERAVRLAEHGADHRLRVRPLLAYSVREAARRPRAPRRCARGSRRAATRRSCQSPHERVLDRRAGQRQRGGGERRQQHEAARRQQHDQAAAGRHARAMPRRRPATASMSAWQRPRKPSASSTSATTTTPV